MDITVILCTYNRDQMLVRTLKSVADSVLPTSVDWEVLVVDNNSTDRTRAVTEEFCRSCPGRFRYLFEGRQGKSFALNAGICNAKGRILAFTDDDVVVEPTWLWNLTSSIYEGKSVGVGGRTLPNWNLKPPRWLPSRERYALAPLAVFDLGSEPGPLLEAPFGNNMAFSRTVVEGQGGFRTDLGPTPDSLLRGEDSDFGDRLLAAGERLWYQPSAIVYHPVHENRVREEYFLAWWFDKARADVRVRGIAQGTKWFVAGVPLCLLRRIAVWTVRWLTALEPSRRFECKLNVWGRAGEIVEFRRRHQSHAN